MKDDEIKAIVWLGKSSNKKVTARVSGEKAVRKTVELGVSCVERADGFTKETAEIMAEKNVCYVPCLCLNENPEERKKAVAFAKDAGVMICTGTSILPSEPMDGTVAIIRELELLCEAGLSPIEAINAATIDAARFVGIPMGVLAEGNQADIIAVKGEPDHEIRAMRNLALVIKNGRMVWSEVPGFKCRRFNVVHALFSVEGGATKNWR
jgi:imidazolonepropionase-like amidohydrolase